MKKANVKIHFANNKVNFSDKNIKILTDSGHITTGANKRN